MTMQQTSPWTIDALVAHYLDSRGGFTQPISTRHALIALRTAVPKCDLSDRQLIDLVAGQAVERGCSVSFDTDTQASGKI